MYYIGVDCGTQGTKAIVFDSQSGKVLSKGYAKHPIIAQEDGTREQKAEWWISALNEAVLTALEKSNINRNEVKAISVSGQQHGLVLLDEDGNVLRDAKLWNDTSTAPENAAIIEQAGGADKVQELLGTALPVGYTASKIRYVAEKEPELYKKTAHVLLPHDYINFYLTGVYATESSEASGTGYYDVNKREYSEKMLNTIDASGVLKNALPPVYPWEKPIGSILPEIAKRWGLNDSVLVAAGGGDNTMGSIGTCAIVEGYCTMTLGTSGTVVMQTSSKSKPLDKLVQVYDVLNTKQLVAICTLNATSATTTIQELFDMTVPELDEAIAASTPGSEGVVVLPFFDGERMPPLPESYCAIKNVTSLNCKKEHIVRATAEAVIFTLKWGFNKLMDVFPKPEQLIITGGGGNSTPWRQIVADVFDLPVCCLQSDEGGALGAALQAMYAERNNSGEKVTLEDLCLKYVAFNDTNKTVPIKENVESYKKHFDTYINAIENEWM